MRTLIDEILQTTGFSSKGEKAGVHPSLGYGKSILLENEYQHHEFSFHPMLGKGRQVSWETENEMEEELVGTDDRTRITDTKPVPFRWMCHLELDFPDPDDSSKGIRFSGSGVLISPRHILTAGHCLYSGYSGSRNTSTVKHVRRVTAYIGRNATSFLGSAQSVAVKVHSNWQSSRNARFDIGIIKLDRNIGDQTFSSLGNQKLGFWGSPTNGFKSKLVPLEKNQFLNQMVNVAGYPGDKPNWLMTAWDKVVNVNPKGGSELIYYHTDTCAGQSGGPVWKNYSDGSRYLIAIHTGPCIPGYSDCNAVAGAPCFPDTQRYSSNRGVFLTRVLIDMINQWIGTI